MSNLLCSAPIEPACPNAARYRRTGYCGTHQSQLYKWGKVFPAGVSRRKKVKSLTDRDELGRKFCGRCEVWKDEEFFSVSKHRTDGLQQHCRPCRAEISKARPKDRIKQRERRFNVPAGWIEKTLKEQGDACAICKSPEFPGKKGSAIDHDHSCCPGSESCGKCVRGILCQHCNVSLGFANDDEERLLAMIDYIRRHRR